MDRLEIDIPLQPQQVALLRAVEESPHTVVGFGGARGGAKSHGSRAVMLLRRLKLAVTDGLLLRRTFPDLRENHIEPLWRQYPFLRRFYNASDHVLTVPNGSRLVFGSAEHSGDVFGFQGQQYLDIAVDEAEEFTGAELQFLRTCNRWPGVSQDQCRSWYTMNPGGVGHSYLKRLFIDRQYHENERPGDYVFLPAHGWDNVEWARAALVDDGLADSDYYQWPDERRFRYFIERTDYGRRLDALPERLRIPHLLGRWDWFEGQVFAGLDEAVHNLDRWADPFDPRGCLLVDSLDHASTGITAWLQTALDRDENLFAIGEYYEANKLIEDHAAAILGLRGGFGRRPSYSLIDPSTQARTLQGSMATHPKQYQQQKELTSVLDEYVRHGLEFAPAERASVDVGLNVLQAYLRIDPKRRHPFTQQLGSPRLFISKRRCPNLWREMEEFQLVRDPAGGVRYVGADHALDNLRYIAMSRPKPEELSLDEQWNEQAAEIRQEHPEVDVNALIRLNSRFRQEHQPRLTFFGGRRG